IADELRIKDIEFVEKNLDGLKKQTARGGQSLEMKKMKEEQAFVESVLAWLKDGKDVRKKNWNAKEVCYFLPVYPFFGEEDEEEETRKKRRGVFMMIKSPKARSFKPSSSNASFYITLRSY